MRKGNSKLLIRNLRKQADKKQLNIGVVSEWYHCQSEIEGNDECKEQCEHCKQYYKETDNGR